MPKFKFCLDYQGQEEVLTGTINAKDFPDAQKKILDDFDRGLTITKDLTN